MSKPSNPQADILREARLEAGLSLRELARRAGTSHATLHAYETGKKVPSVTTFLGILDACGFAVDIDLERRVREADGIPRGEELVAVMALAAQFPARLPREMNFPVFGRSDD